MISNARVFERTISRTLSKYAKTAQNSSEFEQVKAICLKKLF